MQRRSSSLKWVVGCTLAGALASGPGPALAQSVVFEVIEHPDAGESLPGPDQLLGTPDDTASAGLNVAGTLGYTRFINVSPLAGSNVHAFFRGTITVNDVPAPFQEQVVISDFEVALSNEQTTGPPTQSNDIGRLPHELIFGLPGTFELHYTLETCSQFGCLETDESRTGFWIRPGDDPFAISGIPLHLASYLDFLATAAPSGWTAIAMARVVRAPLTESNTRGPLASLFVGGFANGLTAIATTDPFPVPEPGASAQAFAVLLVLTASCGRCRRA